MSVASQLGMRSLLAICLLTACGDVTPLETTEESVAETAASATLVDIPTLRVRVINNDPPGPPVALGSIFVAPIDEVCGASGQLLETCVYDLPNTTVTLTAVDECSSFVGWTGACSGANRSCTFTLNADATVIATFRIASCL